MSMTASLEKMRELTSDVRDEALRFQEGNDTAGVRLRNTLLEIQKITRDVRASVQDTRKKREQIKRSMT